MNDEFEPIKELDSVEEDSPATKNQFPILVQLLVLCLILTGIFSAFLFKGYRDTLVHSSPASPMAAEKTPDASVEKTPTRIEDISITAHAAYVWDVRAQRVLYAKNENEQLPLASITKLMTALIAHELIASEELTSVPQSAIRQEGNSGLVEGEQFDIETLRELALISSSNDAAYTLAASVGSLLGDDDPAEQFIVGMNVRAEELGLESLRFKSATGLDISPTEPGAVGTARDVSFLMEYIVTHYPSIIAPTTQAETRVYNTSGVYHEVENTNDVVKDIPNLIGSKTGYTDLAGGNLTIAFDLGFDHPIIITVLRSTRDDRFTDVLTLVKAVQATVSNE